jgi:hypothetical protein
MFGGLPDVDVRQLSELASRDPAAAVLEFNERVLNFGLSGAKTCSMRLRYNATADPKKLAEIFRDQVNN